MKSQLWTILPRALAIVGLASLSPAWAQPEMFLGSYPNANITIDGLTDDWNLGQFETRVSGGTNGAQDILDFNDDFAWERTAGTGDVAYVGWDDTNENFLYGSRVWTFPENPDGTTPVDAMDSVPPDVVDLAATIYARHNTTHNYFLVIVEDDEVNTVNDQTDAQAPEVHPNGAAWLNDSVEFFIDPDASGGPRDVEHDVQLVIDAGGQVQVWDSSAAYASQVEAGVEANVTITDTGYTIEVAIEKSVFAVPLPSNLGPANDPDGNNFNIDFNIRDMDDPLDTNPGNDNDTAFSTVLAWAEPGGAGAGGKEPDDWGQLFAMEVASLAGDYDGDLDVDGNDFLAWQRGESPTALSAEDLATWESNFGTQAGLASAGAAPEPSGLFLAIAGAGIYGAVSRGRQLRLRRSTSIAPPALNLISRLEQWAVLGVRCRRR
ncbi:MAG: sugar-binding protein [Planctomycetota bacterium]